MSGKRRSKKGYCSGVEDIAGRWKVRWLGSSRGREMMAWRISFCPGAGRVVHLPRGLGGRGGGRELRAAGVRESELLHHWFAALSFAREMYPLLSVVLALAELRSGCVCAGNPALPDATSYVSVCLCLDILQTFMTDFSGVHVPYLTIPLVKFSSALPQQIRTYTCIYRHMKWNMYIHVGVAVARGGCT